MQNEDYLNPDINEPIPAADKPKRRVSAGWLWVHGLLFVIGFGLLIWLVYSYWGQVRESVLNVGWGFAVVVTLNLIRHFGRALSMYRAVAPEHRNFKYRSAVLARFGGEAVNFFTFTGPFLGDATKAMLLRRNTPITQSASAVIIDNILYYITVILVVIAGVGLLIMNYGSSSPTMSRILLAIVVVALILISGLFVAMMKRSEPFSHIIGFLDRRGWAPGFITRKWDGIRDVEKNVFQFYHDRKSDFFLVFAISLTVHMVSVAEVYCVLIFLGEHASVSNAFIIESLTKVINAVFSFIPGTIGVYEGGNGLILRTLKYGTGVGVALALVRRAAILFSTAIGCIVLIWRTAEGGAKRLKKDRDD
ncbi:MAG TPA: flippase-like domain-containing protein [Pyrinomonadaceae bacterium]|jgi:uncharacterized protein (TIRG00374 family)|nr:flippase-like domain-containing protein [Pyrinomonadaceae bacterium]